MSEELPESVKMKILKKWMIELEAKSKVNERNIQQIDVEKYVYSKLSDDRAVELLDKTKVHYPEHYPQVLNLLYQLIIKGVLKEIDGYTLYNILLRLGIKVQPEIRIRFVKDGKEVDFKEYVGRK